MPTFLAVPLGGSPDTGHVFTTETGQPVDPRNLLRVVQAAASRAGLKDVGIYSLRHLAAIAMLEAGVNIKAVSGLLGHSSVSITGDIYGHTSDDSAQLSPSSPMPLVSEPGFSALLHPSRYTAKAASGFLRKRPLTC